LIQQQRAVKKISDPIEKKREGQGSRGLHSPVSVREETTH